MALRRFVRLLTCVIALFTAANALAEGMITWTLTSGPTGGSVNVLLSVPAANLIFAGTNGGIYQTHDQGLHWRTASDGLPDDRSVLALASAPDASVLFAGTRGGVFRSRDLATTWKPVLVEQSILSLLVDPQNANLIYAGTTTTLFRSENGGDTWIDLGQSFRNASVWSLVLAPSPGSTTLYVASDSGGTAITCSLLPSR